MAAEATIAGDEAARASLASLTAAQRAVTVIQQGPATDAVDHRAQALLAGLGLTGGITRVTLLGAVRLGGTVVRPAAIAPLGRWVTGGPAIASCRPRGCPMVSVGAPPRSRPLSAPGVRLSVVGRGELRSAAPLGFAPPAAGQPVLVSGDVAGLDSLPALRSVYRTESWLAVPVLARLHSWQLAAVQRRLDRAQASLPSTGGLTLTGPADALAQARARATAAPERLLPAGGGALAALAMFVVLAAYGLRCEQRGDRERLRAAGARGGQLAAFSLIEAAALSAIALIAGAAAGVIASALLAGGAGLPVGAVLSHSLLTGTGIAVLAGGWIAATAVIGAVLLVDGGAIADVIAVAAAAALALAVVVGGSSDGTLALLVAPLACVATGALVVRLTSVALRAGERLARRGPLTLRLAVVSLARAPVAPALAVAFVAVSPGSAALRSPTARRSSAEPSTRPPRQSDSTPV